MVKTDRQAPGAQLDSPHTDRRNRHWFHRLLVDALLLLLRAYQLLISPLIGPRCRFYPSCSSYAAQALQSHGIVRGGWLGLKRLVRCHPGNPGGIDEVPASLHGTSCTDGCSPHKTA